MSLQCGAVVPLIKPKAAWSRDVHTPSWCKHSAPERHAYLLSVVASPGVSTSGVSTAAAMSTAMLNKRNASSREAGMRSSGCLANLCSLCTRAAMVATHGGSAAAGDGALVWPEGWEAMEVGRSDGQCVPLPRCTLLRWPGRAASQSACSPQLSDCAVSVNRGQ